MPLTLSQAREDYINNSMMHFVDRKISALYTADAVATAGKPEDISQGQLRVRIGRSDDPNIVLNPPVIAIDVLEPSDKNRFYEMGTANALRHQNFVFCCYPALRLDGNPSLFAAMLLKSYVRRCFGGEFIRVIDYGNPSCTPSNIIYCTDGMWITGCVGPIDNRHRSPVAQERHRFDYHVSVQYAVTEDMGT